MFVFTELEDLHHLPHLVLLESSRMTCLAPSTNSLMNDGNTPSPNLLSPRWLQSIDRTYIMGLEKRVCNPASMVHGWSMTVMKQSKRAESVIMEVMVAGRDNDLSYTIHHPQTYWCWTPSIPGRGGPGSLTQLRAGLLLRNRTLFIMSYCCVCVNLLHIFLSFKFIG